MIHDSAMRRGTVHKEAKIKRCNSLTNLRPERNSESLSVNSTGHSIFPVIFKGRRGWHERGVPPCNLGIWLMRLCAVVPSSFCTSVK